MRSFWLFIAVLATMVTASVFGLNTHRYFLFVFYSIGYATLFVLGFRLFHNGSRWMKRGMILFLLIMISLDTLVLKEVDYRRDLYFQPRINSMMRYFSAHKQSSGGCLEASHINRMRVFAEPGCPDLYRAEVGELRFFVEKFVDLSLAVYAAPLIAMGLVIFGSIYGCIEWVVSALTT